MTAENASRVDVPHHPLGPERIRALRGALSRAAFARRIGVTPHTVYRWELPADAAEARRPRGAELEKLRLLAAGGEPELTVLNPPPTIEPPISVRVAVSEADVASVLPALERVLAGDHRKGHGELVQLVTMKAGLSPSARALARYGVALVELLLRSDSRAALLVISPALADAEASALSREVSARVFAVAALVHALPDVSLFDVGRVNAYASRAEALSLPTEREARSLACLSSIYASILMGDKELLERAFVKLDEAELNDLPELLDVHVEEFRGLRPVFAGKTTPSTRSLEMLSERAERRGYATLQARTLGHLGMRLLENLADPHTILNMARQAKEIARGARVGPGIHSVFALRVEMEALLRLGRIPEAFVAQKELEAWTAETGILPIACVSTLARLFFISGRHSELTLLAERLASCEMSAIRRISQAYSAYVHAVACLASSDDPEATVRAFERAEPEGKAWHFLMRDVLTQRIVAHLVAGQQNAARATLRRAQRLLDAFPSAWVTAHLRRIEGMLLATSGQWIAGRQLLDSAIATFELAQDVCDAALCRYVVAAFSRAIDGEHAEDDVLETRRALEQLGITPPRALRVGLETMHMEREGEPPRSSGRLIIDSLIVPIQRLSVRGAVPSVILRELVSIVSNLFPEHALRLEELDSSGAARLIAGAAAEHEFEWAEFSDGAGRLLRIGLSTTLSDTERATLDILAMTASLALEAAVLRGAHTEAELPAHDERAPELPGFVAASPAMRKLRSEIVRLKGSRATVIITGESGAGKELVARAIHDLSERSSKSYVAFNCATVPRDLFEGQLFGYRKGAFTGAIADHPGVIRAADGGTLFLDEIGELPLDIQPKLLRFIENSEVFPLGERRPIRVDVRVIAATHRNLATLVREGRFREDLYYRLQVVPIHVQPLRERREDIPVLARYFVRELSRDREPPVLAPDALAALSAYDWPGNVRELRNVIERSLAFSPTPDVLRAEHLRLVA